MPKGKGTKAKSLNIKSSREIKELKSILDNGCVTIVVILAEWCGACKRVKPHWLNMLKKRNEKNVVLIDNEELPHTQLRDSLNITHFPSAFEISPGKEPVLLENVSDPESIERSVNGVTSNSMSKSKSIKASEFIENVNANAKKNANENENDNENENENANENANANANENENTIEKLNESANNTIFTPNKTFTTKEGFTPSLEKLKGGRRTRRNRQKRMRTRRFRKS